MISGWQTAGGGGGGGAEGGQGKGYIQDMNVSITTSGAGKTVPLGNSPSPVE